jgi:hypothetical protein
MSTNDDNFLIVRIFYDSWVTPLKNLLESKIFSTFLTLELYLRQNSSFHILAHNSSAIYIRNAGCSFAS